MQQKIIMHTKEQFSYIWGKNSNDVWTLKEFSNCYKDQFVALVM